jgi:Ca2+-binding RTX toxin-like protein
MAIYNGTAGADSSINDSTQSLGLRLLNGDPVAGKQDPRGDDTLFGFGGADTLQGYGGADSLFGDEGDDILWGHVRPGGAAHAGPTPDGGDFLYAGGGDDEMYGQDGDDYFDPGSGTNTVDGGAGSDDVNYVGSNQAVTVDLAAGTGNAGSYATDTLISIENVFGSHQADHIAGSSASNEIDGLGGNDTLEGGGGTDTVVFTGNRDRYQVTELAGGALLIVDNRTQSEIDADSVHATYKVSNGADTVSGFESFKFKDKTYTRDQLLPDLAKPTVTVDIVDSTLDDADNASQVTFTFSEAIATGSLTLSDVSAANGVLSNLTVAANGLSATATFTAADNVKGTGSVSIAADKFTDVSGNQNSLSNTASVAIDTQNPAVTVDIVDTMLNGADNISLVTFTFSEAIAAGSFTLADVSAANGLLSNLTIAADSLSASATFTATDNVNANGLVSVDADTFTDATGNQNTASNIDTVSINTSTDAKIEGGPGPDMLRGTPGSDIMDGKGGNDTLLGSAGADQMIGGPGNDTVGYTRTVTLNLENANQSTGRAWGDAFSSIERFQFSGGNDKGFGDDGANQFRGGGGNDRFFGAGGNDVLRGENGNDRLAGEDGDDSLLGGNGADVLIGGWGRDRMNGDAGADRYDFNAVQESSVGSQRDVVYLSTGDRIDLRTIDADDDTPGNQAFRWTNRNDLDTAFTGRDGQLRFSNGVIRGDINGDKLADFEIKVVGFFSSGDVIL